MTIGERIKTRRVLAGLSVRRAADLAGIAHTTWSRIERGERGADNRIVLAHMATALRCSVPDLTGSAPGMPATPDEARLAGHITALLSALVETDLNDEATVDAVPLDRLAHDASTMDELRVSGDYAAVAARMPMYARQLHAATVSAVSGPDRETGLRLTVLGSVLAGGILREVGHRAEAYLAGERAHDAATALGDPVMLAAAARSRAAAAMGCGSMARARKLAIAGLAELEGHMDLHGAKEVAGHLHLVTAMSSYGMTDHGTGDTHLAEAEALASSTGDTDTFRMYFGPTNLAFWRLAITVDSGDAREAVRIARSTNAAAIGSVDRQGMFYLDTARALARIGTPDSDAAAVRMMLTAERLTPQRIRAHPFARETLRQIVKRAKRSAIDSKIRGLCERVGVTR
ncbi:helix-turn-helix transcriptional regulator [Stackebrandtia albiflava]